MQIRCPHCQHAIEMVKVESFSDIPCPSCDSHFSLAPETVSTLERPSGDAMVGRFQLVRRLGVGSFGEVWQARDTELDRSVAVKLPRKQSLGEAETEQFLREARAAAQLRHPGIVSVHEVGAQDGRIYIVSDLIQGVDLSERLEASAFSPREACELIVKVAEALQHAHDQGVIHRDLKPANIMLDGDSRAHVMDFGLAKREAGEITMTVEGQILGTPAYMSPEQAKGDAHNADRRSDVYTVGVILFELLTGERPFRGKQRMLLHQIINDDAPSLRRLNNRIPRDLDTICLKCLEKSPERRYQDAAELARDLNNWLEGKPIAARPVSSVERALRWCRRKPALAGFWAVAAVLLITLGVGGWLFAIQQAELAAEQASNAAEQTELRRKSDEARKNAEAAAEVARDQTQLAQRALNDVIFEIQRGLAKAPGTGKVRKKVLGIAFKGLQQIADEYAVSERADRDTIAAYIDMGNLFLEVGTGEDVEWLASVSSDTSVGPQEWTPVTAARLLFERAHGIATRMAAEDESDSEAKYLLAFSIYSLAKVSVLEGRTDEAQRFHQRAYEIRKELADGDATGRFLDDLGSSCIKLGDMANDDGRLPEALQFYKQAHEIAAELAKESPGRETKRQLSIAHQRLGELNAKKKQFDDAMDHLHQALELNKELHTADPNPQTQADLYNTYSQLGYACDWVKRYDEASSFYGQALEIARAMKTSDPESAEADRRLASSLAAVGRMRVKTKAANEAIEFYQQAIAIRERLVKADPNNAKAAADLASAYNGISTALRNDGQYVRALQFYQKRVGLDLAETVKKMAPEGSAGIAGSAAEKTEQASSSTPTTLEARAVSAAKTARQQALAATGGKAEHFARAAHAYVLAAQTLSVGGRQMLGQERRRRQQYLNLSIDCLKEAVAAGYDKLESLRDNADFKDLRELPEFQKLLEGKK